jgi:hypothetical protein
VVQNGVINFHFSSPEKQKIQTIPSPGFPLFNPEFERQIPFRRQVKQVGLLTSGSFYLPCLPIQSRTVTFLQRSSPVTAAGPLLNFTIFPYPVSTGLDF